MITPLPADDYETPIEEFPGYLGMEWDREFRPGPELVGLDTELWKTYIGMLVEENFSRTLTLHLPTGIIKVSVNPHEWLAHVLDQLPAFNVYVDRDPPDAGPAAGIGYIFTLAGESSIDDVRVMIRALSEAIRRDLREIKPGLDDIPRRKLMQLKTRRCELSRLPSTSLSLLVGSLT